MVYPLLFFIADSNSSQEIEPDRVVYTLKQEVWFWTEIVREIGPESETLSYDDGGDGIFKRPQARALDFLHN